MARKAKIYSIRQSTFSAFRQLQQYLDRRFEERQPPLTSCQLLIMDVVVTNESVPQNGITKMAGVDRSTLSDTIQRLESCGYVKRVLSPMDRRTLTVTATKDGITAYEKSLATAQEIETEMLSLIPRVMRGEFIQALGNLRSSTAAVGAVS